MDPNATLAEIRELTKLALDDRDLTSTEAERLAELVADLDRWLTNGNYLPAPWKRSS